MDIIKYKEAEILMKERRELDFIRTNVDARIENGAEIPIFGEKITYCKLKEELSSILSERIQEIDQQIKSL